MVGRRRLCVVATLSLLVAAPAAAADEPALPGGRALVANASVSPNTHLFGDRVQARFDVVVDPAQFDPDRLRVRLRFEPYEAVGGVRETRHSVGRLVHIKYEASLRCLHVACLAPRAETILGGQEEGRAERYTVQFPPVSVLYDRGGRTELLLRKLFRPVQVVSRINTAAPQSGYTASLEPPPPTYRVRPGVLAGAALVLAGLLLLFPLALLARELRARWRATRRWRPLPPLERALALVDWTARREDGDDDRRKALEALALVLEERGARPLAETTRALAWAEEAPTGEPAGAAATDARRALNGGGRGSRA